MRGKTTSLSVKYTTPISYFLFTIFLCSKQTFLKSISSRYLYIYFHYQSISFLIFYQFTFGTMYFQYLRDIQPLAIPCYPQALSFFNLVLLCICIYMLLQLLFILLFLYLCIAVLLFVCLSFWEARLHVYNPCHLTTINNYTTKYKDNKKCGQKLCHKLMFKNFLWGHAS